MPAKRTGNALRIFSPLGHVRYVCHLPLDMPRSDSKLYRQGFMSVHPSIHQWLLASEKAWSQAASL
ncbi:hypothetical protein GMOD_00005538 [Pyrenophora seminiperda CCB06]|uniref:Uncharacterized protein n=1 Tax=Pyrenophora seminiperda CCB06 TaxID=1302712 RepID=A0A3M7M9A5_9PLEO|nr:hypothetical protein GMOD_00005538 [Pyrenophora seminiperda CCB06]